MPKLNGRQFTKNVKNIRSDIPIILCSGFGDIISKDEIEKWGMEAIIMKPFSIAQLSNRINTALGK